MWKDVVKKMAQDVRTILFYTLSLVAMIIMAVGPNMISETTGNSLWLLLYAWMSLFLVIAWAANARERVEEEKRRERCKAEYGVEY